MAGEATGSVMERAGGEVTMVGRTVPAGRWTGAAGGVPGTAAPLPVAFKGGLSCVSAGGGPGSAAIRRCPCTAGCRRLGGRASPAAPVAAQPLSASGNPSDSKSIV